MGRQTVLKPSAGSAQVVVNLKHLNALLIPVPSPVEQQRIAECLSSLDELLAAQARKVDALKTHKKGLMQQLFPREGETQPRLRFPEFQNGGEWQQKPLSGLCRIRTGKKDANEGAADGAYPFFTCAEKHIYSHNYSFDAEAILIAGNANVGQTSYYIGKFEAYQRTYVLTDFKGIFVPYLYSLLNANLRPDLLAQVQTSAMSYIRLPMLEEYQINAPPSQAEQHRIATCLSSLDALITAETQKHEALKTHKRGLMQQLFPSPEEATS
jgi:type I restriction enzyme S subunit